MLTIHIDDSHDLSGRWNLELIQETRSRAASALTKTAAKAVEEIKDDLPQKFTMRKNWVHKGIRGDRANRTTLETRVYSVDNYMLKQEEGQLYRPEGHVAIPSAARPTAKAPIPRHLLPNSLRGRPDIFKFDFSRNPAYKPYPLVGIFQRVMRGKQFRVMYLLKDEKNTRPLWKFTPQVEWVIDRYFDQYFDDPDSPSIKDG
ncbi:MAG TPA: hypothetical protein VE954_22100 [Oligoflexus sp.]|uniref:hypothetical protein n=1 Tax=Oligoflexus sp. TaxID=1971216 RepID=UPI002D3D314B|nr:hypothetical protein [Oligoflexus sp.]HYX35800.1 hypothetical protein [Oligoflexus sp.]